MLRQKTPCIKKTRAVPYNLCPAKTYTDVNGEVKLGRSVLEHCKIVGEVAKEMIERFPPVIRDCLFAEASALVAAAHDIGKVSPYFYAKLMVASSAHADLRNFNLESINPSLERQWGGHAGVTQISLKDMKVPDYIPELLGQHHGFSPNVRGKLATDEIFGGVQWQIERTALVRELKCYFGMDWPVIRDIAGAQLLAGLTTVADWIGSGGFFENPEVPWHSNIAKAVDEAGFVAVSYRENLSFGEIFGFEPREEQSAFYQVVNAPGTYILEAPMGVGKTEAALYAAYKMLVHGKASGIYFALPTQLTSNKIYERLEMFLNQIMSQNKGPRARLLHSNAWMLESDMGEDASPGGAWFNGVKRGILAPFAVGTVDQALMAAMNVKHGFVRAFGLSGKVVIIDELHTYDVYTSTILDAVIELLRALHCTVIILSATLSKKRREQVLGHPLYENSYPLITASPLGQSSVERALSVQMCHKISISFPSDYTLALSAAIERAAEGQQVVWIENTIKEAQHIFYNIAARASECGVECGLLHSRFIPVDRDRLESIWVSRYGKNGWKERSHCGRILIGTQVLEQSLDIDADFMVTRFAPSDMLLQRLGRLWRHDQTPRPQSASCEVFILAPLLEKAVSEPYENFGSSASVYSPYLLCRSLEVWRTRLSIELPTDIRLIIDQTYNDRLEKGEWARWQTELEEGKWPRKGLKALQQLACLTLAQGGKTLPERKAETRYSETESCQLLLIRSINQCQDQRLTRFILLDGKEISVPCAKYRMTKKEWRKVSCELARQVVSIPVIDAPTAPSLDILRKLGLHHCFHISDDVYSGIDDAENDKIRVATVENTGILRGIFGSPLHPRHLHEYRPDFGYRVVKDC